MKCMQICSSFLCLLYSIGTCDIGADCVFFESSYSGSPDPAPKTKECKDGLSDNQCASYKDYCEGDYKDYMTENCPKTCDKCPGASKQSTCDMSKTFGKLNGDHILTFTANGG